jgi:hypothetical protein
MPMFNPLVNYVLLTTAAPFLLREGQAVPGGLDAILPKGWVTQGDLDLKVHGKWGWITQNSESTTHIESTPLVALSTVDEAEFRIPAGGNGK